MKNTKLTAAVLLSVVLALLAGCAQDMEEIDRTQHNILAKEQLKGEWYFTQTIIEAPYASAYSFVGDQGKLERGVFEIQEDNLIFYRTYEFAENIEAPGLKGDTDVPLTDDDGNILGTAFKDGSSTIQCEEDYECITTTGKPYATCGVAQDVEDSGMVCVSPRYIYRGAPIIAFPIKSHLDVIWDYNPNTGEKTNVKSENTSDRMWYEREYIRVDWGGVQLTNYEFTLGFLVDDVAFSIYEGDSSAPEDMPVIEDDYMDFTVQYVLGSALMYYEYYDMMIPLCYMYPWYAGGVYECTSEVLKARNAFLKVKPSDYVPEEFDDKEMDKFGYFRAERLYYDDNYDMTYTGANRNITRHKIWETYVQNDDGSLNYSQMDPKPIVYYINEDFPRDLVSAAKSLASQWSEPFEDTVEALKGQKPSFPMFILCENNDELAADAAAQGFDTAEYTGTTYGSYCADMDKTKRDGDLRYNFIRAVVAPTTVGLYGYGPSAADPITGEIIQAAANIYTPALYRGANRALDYIMVMSGAMSIQEYVNTEYISEPMRAKKLTVNNQIVNLGAIDEAQAKTVASSAVAPDVAMKLSAGQMIMKGDSNYAYNRMKIIENAPDLQAAMIIADFRALYKDFSDVTDEESLTVSQVDNMSLHKWANYNGWKKKESYYKAMASKTLYLEEFYDPGLGALVEYYGDQFNTEICEMFDPANVDGEYTYVFDYEEFNEVGAACDTPGTVNDEGWTCTTLTTESPDGGTYWVNTCTVDKLRNQLAYIMIDYDGLNPYDYTTDWLPMSYFNDSKSPELDATQKALKDAIYGKRQDIIDEIYVKMFLGVAIHEVGHTLGLRHNFEGSTDAMNYPEEYWKLKVSKNGDGKYLPVKLWGETKQQTTQGQLGGQPLGMRVLQWASVMDYGSKFASDLIPLGLYDKAAIKFGYGGLVEVFNSKPDLSEWEPYLEDPDGIVSFGLAPLKPMSDNPMEEIFRRVHYTQIPNAFGDVAKMYDRKNVLWSEVKGDACTSDADCSGGKLCKTFMDGSYCGIDVQEVPYRNCPDELAFGVPTCLLWDEGADPFEIAYNSLSDTEHYLLFWGTWAQQANFFNADNYYGRILRNYWQAAMQYKYYVLNYARYNANDWWEDKYGQRYEEDLNGGLAGSMAAYYSFNFLAMQFGRPTASIFSPEIFGINENTGDYEIVISAKQSDFSNFMRLNIKDGLWPMYADYQSGGDTMFQILAGAVYNRLAAFEVLTDPTTNLFAIEESADTERYLINYYTMFPIPMLKLFGSIMVGKLDGYSWLVNMAPDNTGAMKPQSVQPRWMVEVPELGMVNPPEDTTININPEQPDEYYFPTTKFRIPMLAAYYGMSFMTAGYDKTFFDATRVFLEGHKGGIEIPEDAETVTFEDPLSGKIYVAYKYGDVDEEDQEISAAYYLVSLAQEVFTGYNDLDELQKDYLDPKSPIAFIIGKLELMRGMVLTYELGE